jgi:hypothetical protein
MWKKMSIAIALGLFLSPSGVLAATTNAQFDPFAGIVAGIAQGMATSGDFTTESNYDGSATGNGNRIAGNVIIGSPIAEQAQMAVVDGTIDFKMNGSSGTSQAVNLIAHDGEVPVLVMQGTSAGDSITMASSNADSSVQAINLVTR